MAKSFVTAALVSGPAERNAPRMPLLFFFWYRMVVCAVFERTPCDTPFGNWLSKDPNVNKLFELNTFLAKPRHIRK